LYLLMREHMVFCLAYVVLIYESTHGVLFSLHGTY
jgi:hypothetical protein